MKLSTKAVLLSAFIFPGTGHLYLKQYLRGLAIMLIGLSGLGFIIWSVTESMFNHLDSVMVKMQGNPSLKGISDIVGSETLTAAPYSDVVFYLLVCLWIFAIIDAYKQGKRNESRGKTFTF
jgi:hypothetical protein